MRSAVLTIAAMAALPACKDECGCREASRYATEAEIGTGDEAFSPVEEGGEIPFVQGPQGGWHVFGAARLTGLAGGEEDSFLDPCLPGFDFEVHAADGSFADVVEETWWYVPTERGTGDLTGVLVILGIGSANEADGAAVTYGVRAEDACGNVAEHSRDGVLRFMGPAG